LSGSLAAGQDLGSGLGDFALQLVELLLHNIFIIREVCFQPLKSAGVIFGLEVLLEFVQLLVGHLVGQTDTDAHFQCFVDMLQEAVFFGGR
jgi:hypothetical protein